MNLLIQENIKTKNQMKD